MGPFQFKQVLTDFFHFCVSSPTGIVVVSHLIGCRICGNLLTVTYPPGLVRYIVTNPHPHTHTHTFQDLFIMLSSLCPCPLQGHRSAHGAEYILHAMSVKLHIQHFRWGEKKLPLNFNVFIHMMWPTSRLE